MPIQNKFSIDAEVGLLSGLKPVNRRQPPVSRKTGAWGVNDEPVTSGGWGANDELVTGGWGADDELVDESARRALPAGVKPNEKAGAGRGGIGGPTADQLSRTRRGTSRGVQPYVAEEPTNILDRPAPNYQDQPGWEGAMGADEMTPEAAKARAGIRPTLPEMRASPERGALARAADWTLRKPMDGSLGGLALEAAGDAGRGVVRASESMAGSMYSAGQAAAEMVGAGDTAFAKFAGSAGKVARQAQEQMGNPIDRDSLTQQVFESTFSNLPIIGMLGAGNKALAAMGAMSAANDYGESRDAGKSHDQSLGRAAFMGIAEVVGERFGLPQIGQLFAKAAGRATTKEMGHLLAEILVKEQIGEQVTTALQDGYEKFGEQGRKPNMTLSDYLDDVANTAKVTLGQSLLMGAGAAGVRALPNMNSPERQIADAINSNVVGTHIRQDAIDGFARRAATDPNFFTPGMVDPSSTTRAPVDVGPPAPVRAEDMPTTPWTPEQSAVMAAESQARKQAQAAQAAQAAQDGAQRADGNAVAPMPQPAGIEPLQGRQATGNQEIEQTNRAGADRTQRPADEATRGVQDRAGIAQPGQLAQGSLADEARRRIAAKTPAAGADEVAAPTGQPQRTPGTTEDSSGIRQQAAQPAASITAPAKIEPAEAGSKLPPTEQAASGGGTSALAPSPAPADAFASRDAALVAAAERGQWQRLEPAQAPDGTWRLTDRQQPAPAAPTAPPKAAQQGADVAQTHAEPKSTGSTATGQAAPKQDTQPQAEILNRQSRPEATPPQAQATDLQSAATTATTTAGAAHAEPGGQAGPATAPVVAQSPAKAADNTERKPSELRADLVRQIDAAMAGAPDEDLPVWKRPTQERLRQAMADLGLPSVDRAEKALRTAHDNRVADTASRIGFADFDVPGDGAFKVLRTASRLVEFKRLVEKSAGFKAQRASTAPELDGAQRGSPSVKAAVESMLAEGDAQAAADYLDAKGLDAAGMGLPASALAKLAGVTPTTQQADEPAGQAATESGNGAQASRQATDATASSRESTPPSDNAEALSGRPHELAQADFIKATDFARNGDAANPWSARWRGVQLEADDAGVDHPDLGKTVVAGGRFFPTRKTAMAAAKAAHRRAVQRAQRQGDQISEKVLADYPDLTPKKPADQPPLGGEVAPDGIGIERAELRGVSVTMEAQIEETGETATFTVDAAKFLDRLDRIERKALDGRLVSADSVQFTQRLADHLADGVEPAQARRLAMADEIERTREERSELADNLRQQHPELFLGQPADAAAVGDAAEVSDDGEPGAEQARIADETGEKIGGSRRDRWAGRGMNLSDLDAMSEAEGAELVTKAAVWKPDFAAMVAAGSHPKTVAMVKLVTDSLAAKPKDNTPVGRRRYVASMQAVRQAYGDLGQHGEGLHGVEGMARQVLQRAAEKLRTELGVHSADPATVREARAVLFSVYRGRVDPFAVGYSIEQRAAKLVADGFPSKAEPWTRRFEIKTFGGAGLTDAGVASYLKTAESLASGITAEQLRAGAFMVVGKGSAKARAMAASKADAQAAARTVYAAELTEKPDGKEEPARPHLDKIQRDGLPLRIDRDVTADDLLQTFGFRGTEFGNWAAQDERQRILNLAFDGLTDLADILNVPPEALSLNGSLGLAFGARGSGRFAAHYEPGKLVINLTKLQGGGNLAHEWAHAVDHYLGELDRPDAYQPAARGASGWYSKRDYTGQAQRRMVQENGKWMMREQASLGNLRPELAAAVNKVMAALYGKALPQAEAVRAAELRLERLQARRTEVEPGGDAKLLASFDTALQDAQRTLADAQVGLPQGSVTTDFAKQAQRLSGKQTNGYWLRPTEMLARAFEAYAFDRLVAMGARSQYLVHGVEADRFAGAGYKGNPYPVGEERAAINAAFDGLVKTLQTKRTDKGLALFQRRGSEGSEGSRTLIKVDGDDFSGSAESSALRALSENDELFALPRSSAATVEAIAADIDPQIYRRDGRSQPDTGRVASPEQVSAVQAAAARITAAWQNAPEIRVLASMADAPAAARDADQRQRDAGATGTPSAFILGGRVYLLASELPTDADVASAVLHEAAGHLGLRGVFGPELAAVLGELAALREADVRAKASEYGLDFNIKADRLIAAEELLAELAQTEPELGLVQRAIAAIRTWLRKNLPMLADRALSDAEIIRSVILPARAFVVDGTVSRGAGATGQAGAGAAFARRRKGAEGSESDRSDDPGASMAGFRAWLERTGPDAGAAVRFTNTADSADAPAPAAAPHGTLPDTVEVDGEQRPTRNSAGQPLGVDDEAVRDFWRRFAGSAVVDAQGRPLLLHGATGAQGGFSAVEKGRLGAGAYFRESNDGALQDRAAERNPLGARLPTAGPGYLALRNPYLFNDAAYAWPDGFIIGGPLATVAQPARPPRQPPGSPLASLLDRVLPPTQARTNRLAMARRDGVIGPALRDQLEAMGHDGLVVRFADPADGEPAYIAFDRCRAIPAWQGEPGADATGGTSHTTGGTRDTTGGTSIDAGGRPGGQQTRLPESIDVDGQQRSTRDASNHYIAASTEAITNFWRWFAGSLASDSQGRPIPLFHGTGHDVDAFMASRSGMLGSGVYITGNAASANEYATLFNENDEGRVMSVYARLRNPYFFAMRESWLPDWYDAPIKSEFKHPEDLPWGITLVADVMPRDSARRIIDRLLREGTINIGASLTDRLKAMGHDGIVAFDGEANPARKPDDSIWTDPKNEVVVFDPRAIKSATGNTGEYAEGTRSIRFQRRPVSAEDQPAADFTLRPFGRAGRVIEVMQDRYNRWKHAIDDIRKQGGSVTDDNDFYRAEERYWGQVGSGIEDFKDQLKGFVKAVAADGLRIEDVALYAYAQHAEERNEWVAAHRSDSPDSGSGMNTDEADEILQAAREAGVEAELKRHALTLRRWIQGTRDALFDGGLIDQQEHDTWTNMFQKYVPLRGGGAAGQAGAGAAGAAALRGKPKGGIRGDEGEHAQGRTSQALQIIEQIAHDRARALIRSGRNNVLRSFARFVLDNPSPELWEINAVKARRQATTDEDGYRTLTETEEVIKDGRTITLKDGGEEIHILVHDAKLLEQLQRMGLDERPAWAIGALLSANRWLSRVYTSLSPVFTAMNALRDTQAAAVGMIDEIGFLGSPKLFAALPSAWAESFKAELMGKQSADYQLFKALGRLTHFHSLKSIEQQADELQAIVNDADRSALDPRKFLPKAMGLIEAINGGIENATRLAAFKVARQSGKTASEASSIAKNITVNFNRKGTQQLASAWVLFFNPSVQGTARLAQAMASPKVQATIGVAMMGIAALALRNAGMGDDDDGVAWWDKIPDEVKERNIVIVLPPGAKAGEAVPKSKTGRYVKIPMPYGYNFFAVVANQVVDVWRHSHDPRRGRDAVKAGGKAFGAFTSSWLPSADLGRAVTADDAESAGKSAVLLAIPDALDPLARIGLNQDAFGRPMRPDNRFSRHLPDSSGYFPGQHGTLFQRGAGALNEATGGSRYREGLIDVAPSTMEHLARSYGGGPVGFGLDIINALYLRQSIARPELDAKRLPFAKQFIGTIDAETDRMTGYQRLESAEKLIDPIKRAMAAGEGREARAMHDEAGPVAGLGDAVVQTRQRLGEIVKRERAAIDSQALSDDAKYVKLIDLAEKRRQVLQRFNKAYDRALLATRRQEREAAE